MILRRVEGGLHGLEPPGWPGGRPLWVPIPVADGQDEAAAAIRWLHTTAGRLIFGERGAVMTVFPDGEVLVRAPTPGLLEGASADDRIEAAEPYVRLADDLSAGRAQLPDPPGPSVSM